MYEVRYVGRKGDNVVSSHTRDGVLLHGADVYGIAIYDGDGVWEADYDLNSIDIVKAAVLLFNHELISYVTLLGILQHLQIDL